MHVRHRVAALVCALLACLPLGCGDGDTEANALIDPSIELPVAARFGATPPRAGRLTLAVDSLGRIHLEDGTCPLENLASALRERLGPMPGWSDSTSGVTEEEVIQEEGTDEGVTEKKTAASSDPKRTLADLPPRDPVPAAEDKAFRPFVRRDDVLLQIDRRVPYALVDRVLRAFVDMKVRLVRLFVAVQGQDGQRGTIAVFLPSDRGVCGGRLVAGIDLDVRVEPASTPDPPGALARALAERRAEAADALFMVMRATPGTHWSAIVATMDEALGANVYAYMFDGISYKLRDVPMQRWIGEAARGTHHAVALRRGPMDISSLRDVLPTDQVPAFEPVPVGRRRGLFGFSNGVAMAGEELIEEELELLDDRRWKPVRAPR